MMIYSVVTTGKFSILYNQECVLNFRKFIFVILGHFHDITDIPKYLQNSVNKDIKLFLNTFRHKGESADLSVILQTQKGEDFILKEFDFENIICCKMKFCEEDNTEKKKNQRDYQQNILDSYDGKAKEHFSIDKQQQKILVDKKAEESNEKTK